MKIYLAGPRYNWREEITNAWNQEAPPLPEIWNQDPFGKLWMHWIRNGINSFHCLEDTTADLDYVGPFHFDPDLPKIYHPKASKGTCAILHSISLCDALVAWIPSDFEGRDNVFAEIGYAAALDKRVWIMFQEKIAENWFVRNLAVDNVVTEDPFMGFLELIPKILDKYNEDLPEDTTEEEDIEEE